MNQETKAGGKFTVEYVITDASGNIKEKGEESLVNTLVPAPGGTFQGKIFFKDKMEALEHDDIVEVQIIEKDVIKTGGRGRPMAVEDVKEE